jgi:hypothetical protein
MLLNNLTKSMNISKKLIPTDESPASLVASSATATAASTPLITSKAVPGPKSSTTPSASSSTSASNESSNNTTPATRKTPFVDNLLEVFVRGESKKYNKDASYHFLAGVFANLSSVTSGAAALRSRSNVDGLIRLSKILPFTEHPDHVRRGGCIATIKNCCFDVEDERAGGLLLSDELNLMPYILLPLVTAEGFDDDDDDLDGIPEELQLLEPTKEKEKDPKLRLMLIESLLLVTQSRPGRDHLRAKKAYPVVKKLHTQEKDEEVMDRIEKLVNMIMRDEEDEAGTQEAAAREAAALRAAASATGGGFVTSREDTSASSSVRQDDVGKVPAKKPRVMEVVEDSDSDEDEEMDTSNINIEELV